MIRLFWNDATIDVDPDLGVRVWIPPQRSITEFVGDLARDVARNRYEADVARMRFDEIEVDGDTVHARVTVRLRPDPQTVNVRIVPCSI